MGVRSTQPAAVGASGCERRDDAWCYSSALLAMQRRVHAVPAWSPEPNPARASAPRAGCRTCSSSARATSRSSRCPRARACGSTSCRSRRSATPPRPPRRAGVALAGPLPCGAPRRSCLRAGPALCAPEAAAMGWRGARRGGALHGSAQITSRARRLPHCSVCREPCAGVGPWQVLCCGAVEF